MEELHIYDGVWEQINAIPLNHRVNAAEVSVAIKRYELYGNMIRNVWAGPWTIELRCVSEL